MQTARRDEKPAMLLVDGEDTLGDSACFLSWVKSVAGAEHLWLCVFNCLNRTWYNRPGFCMFGLNFLFSLIVINPVNNAVKGNQGGGGKRWGFQTRRCAQVHVWSMSLFLACFNASLDVAC